MSTILFDPELFRKAAAALVKIDQTDSLRDLGDAIGAARREHRQRELQQTTGERIYIDGLADVLAKTTGIDRTECWFAVRDAVRPSWSSMALEEIIAFGERTEARA